MSPAAPCLPTARQRNLTLAAGFINESTIGSTLDDFDCTDTEEVNGSPPSSALAPSKTFSNQRTSCAALLQGANVREITAFDSTIWVSEQGGYAVKADIGVAGKTGDNRDFSLTLNVNITDIGQVTGIKP